LIAFLVTLLAFWILAMIVEKLTEKALKVGRRLSALMRDFIGKSVRRIVLAVGFIVALGALGVQIGPLLAVIGAAGFIVAFALQDSLGNLASGIMILIYRPFDVGDAVDVAGVSGKVHSMNLVSTTIRTFDNKVVVVPNNKIWGDIITNITGSTQRRVDMVFGIGYDADIAKAQSILERIVGEHPLVLKDPEPVIRVHELADSSVNFVCRPWSKTPDYWTVFWDVTRAVKEQFDAEGISIPFPQQDIHVRHITSTPPVAPAST
jgi:small conductance mechanosensitive channel